MEATREVLHEVNERHGQHWRLGRRLSGGNQSGAYLLTAPGGRSAVLKWSADRTWAGTVLEAGPVVDALRRRGWPTPAWLAYGATRAGYPYQVQELVAGSTQERITRGWVDVVLPHIEKHRGLATAQMRDWSRYDLDVVFAGRDGCRDEVARSGPAGAELVAVVTATTTPFDRASLPSADLVHGDLNPQNVLIDGGRLTGFVDVEAVGRGTRLHDLANLLLYATLWGEPDAADRLLAECRHLATTGQLEISLSAVALTLMQFGTRNWSADDLATAGRRTSALLVSLAA